MVFPINKKLKVQFNVRVCPTCCLSEEKDTFAERTEAVCQVEKSNVSLSHGVCLNGQPFY